MHKPLNRVFPWLTSWQIPIATKKFKYKKVCVWYAYDSSYTYQAYEDYEFILKKIAHRGFEHNGEPYYQLYVI